MLRAHAPCSSSRRRESEVSIKQILQLPYLKGVSTDQPPKMFAHDSRILNASRGHIGGRVHYILIPETSVQDVEHEMVVLFGQILSLKFQAMRGQYPHSKELVIKDQANREAQRVFTSSNEHGAIRNLIMVNEVCQQQHMIIDQLV